MMRTLLSLLLVAVAVVLPTPRADALSCAPPEYETAAQYIVGAEENGLDLMIARAGGRGLGGLIGDAQVEFEVMVRFGDAPELDRVIGNYMDPWSTPHERGTIVLAQVQRIDGEWDFGQQFLCGGSFTLEEADVPVLVDHAEAIGLETTVVEDTEEGDPEGSGPENNTADGSLGWRLAGGLGLAAVIAIGAGLFVRARRSSTRIH